MMSIYPVRRFSKILAANAAAFLFFWGSMMPGMAQFYNGSQLTFGKNRVQYTDRFWSFLRFDKFDTYYYLEGKPTAIYTARYADKCLKEMQRKFDYNLEDKIQFVIFNKLSDLKQSNIGLLSDDDYNVGGITHIVGSKVFLYFDGSHANLEKQIRAGIATIIVDEMMYGGRITAMIKNSALLSLPDWYIRGLIAYASEEWSTETDNQVRDGIMRGDYRKFNNLTGMDAAFAGQSIWKYIADKYGTGSISNIVYLTKISRNVESGFLFVLGVSFNTLINDWVNHYEQQYSVSESGRTQPGGDMLIKKVKKGVVYSQFRLSPDGKYAAWVTNEMGMMKIWLRDLETGKTKRLLRSGHKLDEKVDYSFPLLAWHPSGKLLAWIVESRGKLLMNFYTVDDHLTEKQRLFNVEKVLDFSFAQNGKMLAMSAVVQGHSDIYVYNIAAHTYEPVTKDIWDDTDPHFVNNSSDIIFASNRPSDTLVYEAPTNFETATDTISEVPRHTDLFMYSYLKKNTVLRRITDSPLADESYPLPYSKNYFTYLSDANGVVNRYVARLDSNISFIDTTTHYRYFTTSYPVTDLSRSLLEQDMATDAGKSAELIFTGGVYRMYISDAVKPKDLKKCSPVNTPYMDQLIRDQNTPRDTSAGLNQEEIEYIKQKKQKKNKRVTNVLVNELDGVQDSAAININNYQFGSDYVVTDSVPRKKRFTIPRAENYNVEYSINQFVSQADFNFLNSSYQQFTGGGSPVYLNPGFNALFKIGIIDLMEDYRITGGVRLSVSLDNSEFFISFDNLKKRLDKSLVFHRQALLSGDEYSVIKLRSNSLYYILKWPFSQVWSIKGTVSARQDRKIYAATDIQNLKQPVITDYWAGLKGELVFDNTRNKGINLYYGSRWKVFGEYFQKIGNEFNNLIVLGLDYRHYTKIHKTFIWANRVAASTSFGNNKLIYYLGGVDNWIVPKFNNDIQVSQSQNYAFQTLATNMRGFTQNIRNGNNFAVLNSELRFPIFRFFSKKPVKSDFFNNFQILGFGDIGTAWTGWNPWSEENTVFKRYLYSGPIKVTLKDIRDPIVGGMGLGLRTRILGYFLRVDYAWGVENLEIQKPVFYISLSTDF